MSNQPTAPHSGDNLLGICHAVGEAIGINPLYLRIALAAVLLVSPTIALLAYAVLGFAVLADVAATRMIAWRAGSMQKRALT